MAYIHRYRRNVLKPNGIRMLVDVTEAIARGTVTTTPQDHTAAKMYKSPDFKAMRELKRRVRERTDRPEMKRQIKSWLGAAACRTGLHRWFFRDKAVIVLFHRVDDRYPRDVISCTTQTFTEFCEFAKRHFTVVPLGVLIERVRAGQDIGRHLVITFDDGYRDNYAAAKELKRLGLPACFFIATDFIESAHVPWWDAEVGIQSEWMTWDQVRELAKDDFELGAHTKNHVDLGVVAGAEAETEIVESGQRLSREIGRPVSLFSYPYGRANQITEENRELVRKAGYVCCVSAYGGTVSPGTDPFYMKRTPLSQWHVSPYHFAFEAMRGS